jgi:Holliday junction resolvase RusA-like endonuclease
VNYFTIGRQLPSLNDYQSACRSHWSKGNKFKKELEEEIGWYIRNAVIKGRLTPVTEQVDLLIVWYEKTAKRDTDNIQSATKFILDAMKKGGIIKDDSRKYVRQIYHVIEDGAESDRVKVQIFKVGALEASFVAHSDR